MSLLCTAWCKQNVMSVPTGHVVVVYCMVQRACFHRSCRGCALQETQELQKKQAWYQQNQVSMSKDDEEDYLNYCSEAMFRIHILELRLNR